MTKVTSTTSPFEGRGGVIVDPARGRAVLVPIVTAYLKRKKLYNRVHREDDAPQLVHLPTDIVRGSTEHARWLFFAAMSDRREQSKMVYRGHKKLWEDHADLLYNQPLPESFTANNVGNLLKPHRFGMWRVTSEHWVINSRILFDRFFGEPRFIYEGKTINDIVKDKKLVKLPGFNVKILSLLAMFYDEAGIIKAPEDAFPIDLHIQRIALSTGIVTITKETTNVYLEEALRPLLVEICRERKWSMVDAAHSLWFLGNKLCTRCPKSADPIVLCPAYDVCGGPFNSAEYSAKGKWHPNSALPKGGTQKGSQFVLDLST